MLIRVIVSAVLFVVCMLLPLTGWVRLLVFWHPTE